MKHKESDMQIRCVKWFRYQYPAFARLLHHPHNEGNAFNSRQQAIANAEGVTKGVADLILHVPSYNHEHEPAGAGCSCSVPNALNPSFDIYPSLAIELKTPTGTQSKEQKQWQRLFQAAGSLYVVVRSYEEFVEVVTRYMLSVPVAVTAAVLSEHARIQREADDEAKAQFNKLLNRP